MIESGHGPRLALEAGEAVGIVGHLLRQHLDRHVPVEPLVVRAVHDAHATLADLGQDPVVAERATDEIAHVQRPAAGVSPRYSTDLSFGRPSFS